MKHKILNSLIEENGYTSYLEVGVAYGHNFQLIRCENKRGVEIENIKNLKVQKLTFKGTSDDFFAQNEDTFDMIFIDGDHHSEQVEKDIVNSYAALNKGGVIVLHDCNPPTEAHQIIPRKQTSWTGDVWRSCVGFKQTYDKINTEYIPEKYGLFAIYKTGRYAVKEGFTNKEMPFKEFSINLLK